MARRRTGRVVRKIDDCSTSESESQSQESGVSDSAR